MMKQKIGLVIITAVLGLTACTKNSEKKIDISQIPITVSIKHLEKELFALKSKQEIREFLKKYPDFTEKFFQISHQTADSVVINHLFKLISTPEFRQFEQEIETYYADNVLEKQFESAFRHIKYYFPDFKAPQIYTTVSFHQDIFVSDSILVIPLEYFMGEKNKFPPPNISQYMLRRYDKPYIVPLCLSEISRKYNATDLRDETLLAEMIWFGKSLEFTSYMMPETPDSLIIGYTEKQTKEIDENKKIVWSHYIERKLFYDKKEYVKMKYVGERPYTAEIGSECPPRTGRWLGWQIVRKYIKNTEKTLPELMKNPNTQQIFTESGYKGE